MALNLNAKHTSGHQHKLTNANASEKRPMPAWQTGQD